MTTFKGSPISLSGTLPVVGSRAKDFLLVNGKLEDIHLRKLEGKKKILVVAPSIDTPVCSTSAKKFNDRAKNLADTVILFISADLPFAQSRFCQAEHVNNIMTLSMMRDKKFAEDYGILIGEGPLKGLCARAIFVLDQENTIRYVELVPEITEEPNYEKALSSAAAT